MHIRENELILSACDWLYLFFDKSMSLDKTCNQYNSLNDNCCSQSQLLNFISISLKWNDTRNLQLCREFHLSGIVVHFHLSEIIAVSGIPLKWNCCTFALKWNWIRLKWKSIWLKWNYTRILLKWNWWFSFWILVKWNWISLK